jgi:hypothetical protein
MTRVTKNKFANEIRTKHPGSYDDLTDEKLVELWLKKFPEDRDKIIKVKLLEFFNVKYYNFLVLLFVCNVVPVYVFYHPGTLFFRHFDEGLGVSTLYKKHNDTWLIVFVFTLIILMYGIKNLKNIKYLLASLISILYIIGLYFYPINYFHFDNNFNHHLNQESIIYSLSIITYNTILSFYYLREFNK